MNDEPRPFDPADVLEWVEHIDREISDVLYGKVLKLSDEMLEYSIRVLADKEDADNPDGGRRFAKAIVMVTLTTEFLRRSIL